jgi:uncharacterized protein YjbI with pentapeptide repeats
MAMTSETSPRTATEILDQHRAWMRSAGYYVASVPDGCTPRRLVWSELSAGDRAVLTGAVLTDADLRRADLTGAVLTDAVLTGAVLTGAVLTDADLTDADLRRADLTDAVLTDAVLTDADLTDAVLTDAVLTDADLTDADLTGAVLTDAVLTGAVLTDAVLTGAVLTDADLRRADLRRADLTDADLRRADLRRADLTGAEDAAKRAAREARRAERFRARNPSIPSIHDLDAQILARVERDPGSFDMSTWHSDDHSDEVCGTTHCRAGWAIVLAGAAGRELENRYGPYAAGAKIYIASTGRVPDFHASDEAALNDIRACAANQVAVSL